MKKLYIVALTEQDRSMLHELIGSWKAPARKITHARILLKADSSPQGPGWKDKQIREALDVGTATIARVRERFAKEGLDAALNRKRSFLTHPRKLDGEVEAHLIALACSQAPEGYRRWSLRLLADKMVELGYVESISHETVRQVPQRGQSSPG